MNQKLNTKRPGGADGIRTRISRVSSRSVLPLNYSPITSPDRFRAYRKTLSRERVSVTHERTVVNSTPALCIHTTTEHLRNQYPLQKNSPFRKSCNKTPLPIPTPYPLKGEDTPLDRLPDLNEVSSPFKGLGVNTTRLFSTEL